MSLSKAHAQEIKEIVGAIYGLTRIAEDDACRAANADEQAAFGPFELGTIHTAIKHLASRADMLAEAIEEVEERLVGGGES